MNAVIAWNTCWLQKEISHDLIQFSMSFKVLLHIINSSNAWWRKEACGKDIRDDLMAHLLLSRSKRKLRIFGKWWMARSMQWNFRAGSRLARVPNLQVLRGTRLDQDQSLMQIVLHSFSPQTVHKASWLDSGQLCTNECTNAVYIRYQYYRYQVPDTCTKIGNYVRRTERPGCLPNVF